MRPTTLLIVAAAGVTVLLLVRVETPGDLGRWDTAALSGEPVLAVSATGDGVPGAVVAGGRSGLAVLDAGGGIGALATVQVTPAPVQALAAGGDRLWVGTEEGLGELTGEGYRQLDLLDGPVHALQVAPDGTLLAGTDSGLHRVDPGAGREATTRLWPAPGEPDQRVVAALLVGDDVLLDHPEGLARLPGGGAPGADGEGAAGDAAEVVVPGVDPVAMGRLAGGETDWLWAGLRGGPLLLVSEDGGRSWQERGTGLGFQATNALAATGDPAAEGTTLRAGGSGLADGTGQAGVMTSTDGARSWAADQDRLSNTHVSGLVARQEPVTLGLRLAGGGDLAHVDVPLPVSTTRWYAATNGSGATTQRPAVPALEAAAPLLPVLRLAEPLLLGSLLLALTVATYRRARLTPLPRSDHIPTYPANHDARNHDPHHQNDPQDPDTKENPHA